MKQKRLTAKMVREILDAITAEEYAAAMNLCEIWRISPREWCFLLHNNTQKPEGLAEIINTKRRERQAQ